MVYRMVGWALMLVLAAASSFVRLYWRQGQFYGMGKHTFISLNDLLLTISVRLVFLSFLLSQKAQKLF
jgi:hypothetical protein